MQLGEPAAATVAWLQQQSSKVPTQYNDLYMTEHIKGCTVMAQMRWLRDLICTWGAPVCLLLKLGKRLLIPLIVKSLHCRQQCLIDVSSPGLTQAMQTRCLPQTCTKASRLLDCTSEVHIRYNVQSLCRRAVQSAKVRAGAACIDHQHKNVIKALLRLVACVYSWTCCCALQGSPGTICRRRFLW